jgi:hypothetical protein
VPVVLARMANDGVILVSAVSSGLSVMLIWKTRTDFCSSYTSAIPSYSVMIYCWQ